MKNYPIVIQHSQEDCGAACLASVCQNYGRNFTLNRTREVVGTGQVGTTLLGLKRGAEALGFNARSVKASFEIFFRIKEAPFQEAFILFYLYVNVQGTSCLTWRSLVGNIWLTH